MPFRGGFRGRSFHVAPRWEHPHPGFGPRRPWGRGRGYGYGYGTPPVIEEVFEDPDALPPDYDPGADDGSDDGDQGSAPLPPTAQAASSGIPVTIVGSAYVPRVPRETRLAALAPVVAPGARGARVSLHFNPATRVLSASLCIDGRCYTGQADLSELLAMAASQIATYHAQLHGDAQAPAAVAQVQGAADEIIACAGEHLAYQAMEQHRGVMAAGWWHDLTSSVKKIAHGAEHGVENVAKKAVSEVGHTLQQLKGPITSAASLAAGAAALAIPGVGPMLAPIASSLSTNLINAATGSGSVQQAAQAAIDQAKQQALSNPQVAQALDIAHQAVTKATVAHQVAQTVANAGAGSPDAQAQLAELTQAAAQGDPAAQDLASMASDLGQAMDATDAADQVVASGAAEELLAQIHDAVHDAPGRFVGYVIPHGNPPQLKVFATSDQADDWFGQWLGMPDAFSYVAYFDKQDATYPGPLNEQYGHGDVKSSGVLPFLLLAGAGAATGAYFWPAIHAKLAQKWPKYFHIG